MLGGKSAFFSLLSFFPKVPEFLHVAFKLPEKHWPTFFFAGFVFKKKCIIVTVLVNVFLDAVWHGIGQGMNTRESGIRTKRRMKQDK